MPLLKTIDHFLDPSFTGHVDGNAPREVYRFNTSDPMQIGHLIYR